MSLNPLDDTQLSVLQIVQTFLQGQDKSTITPGVLGRDADLVVMIDRQIPSDDLIVHFF